MTEKVFKVCLKWGWNFIYEFTEKHSTVRGTYFSMSKYAPINVLFYCVHVCVNRVI